MVRGDLWGFVASSVSPGWSGSGWWSNATALLAWSVPAGVQIVGFSTGGRPTEAAGDGSDPAAALVVSDDGAVRAEPLHPGARLAYTLGGRRCAGVLSDAVHEPCQSPDAPHCDRHADDWPCARCTGRCDLPVSTCREEHAVYLACFAPATFKVGVTQASRFDRRLREQGADRAAHLHTVSDGRIARRIERDLAARIPDRVPVARKVESLYHEVAEDEWTGLLAAHPVIETYAYSYGFRLRHRPVVETLATGTVVGVKGRLCVLRRQSGTYAVDLQELVGYEVRPEPTGRDLQASLGAFEG